MRRTLLILGLLAATLAACGADSGPTGTTPEPTTDPSTTTSPTTAPDRSEGTLAVRLAPVDGFFIEGFEIGLRFESADGTVISSTLWSDYVQSLGEPTLEDYYDSVLEQTVPAGTVTVLAQVNLGIGPPPATPDLDGDFACRLDVDVPVDGRIDVEVDFSGTGDCLHLG